MTRANFCSAFIRLLLALGLVLLAPGGTRLAPLVAAQIEANQSYEAARENFEEVMRAIEELRASLDRTKFDLDDLALELAFEDAATITAWVKENIGYQPYAGVLRGAQGTLASASGNALDQSLLLAGLLGDAGYEVRIARGELSEAQAAELLALTANASFGIDSEAILERAAPVFERLAQLPGVDAGLLRDSFELALQPPQATDGMLAEATGTAQLLTDTLQAGGRGLGGDEVQEALLREARDYAWVEYRFASSDPWTAAHPAFEPAAEVEASEYFGSEIPERLQHRVRIEVTIERKLGDKLEVLPVMDPWERPVANLGDTVITYSNVPNATDPVLEGNLKAALEQSDFFIPVFNGETAPGAQAFDAEGILLEPSLAGDDRAGIFRQVNRGFQDATSLLGGLGRTGTPNNDPMGLTAQWITITTIEPGGEERAHTRTIFDLLGDEARAAGDTFLETGRQQEAKLALMTEQRMMAVPGAVNPLQVVDGLLGRHLELRPFLEYSLALLHGREPETPLEEVVDAVSPLEHLVTVQHFDAHNPAGSGAIAYRHKPTFLVYREGLAGTFDDATGFRSLDIVQNAQRYLERVDGELRANAHFGVKQGVWETISERELIAPDGGGWNATGVLAEAIAAGQELLVLEQGAALENLSLPSEARKNLQRDLEAGYLAVMPASFAEPERAAWFRVDPGTGETLGITADGRGNAFAEYIVTGLDHVSTLVFALVSIVDCKEKNAGNPLGEACCLLKAGANSVVGFGLGNAISKGFSTAVLGRYASDAARLGSELTDFARLSGGVAGLTFGLTSGLSGASISEGFPC